MEELLLSEYNVSEARDENSSETQPGISVDEPRRRRPIDTFRTNSKVVFLMEGFQIEKIR